MTAGARATYRLPLFRRAEPPVLYNMMGSSDSEALLARFGKHTTGKGCLYIKKLADVDQTILDTMVAKSLAATGARKSKTP